MSLCYSLLFIGDSLDRCRGVRTPLIEFLRLSILVDVCHGNHFFQLSCLSWLVVPLHYFCHLQWTQGTILLAKMPLLTHKIKAWIFYLQTVNNIFKLQGHVVAIPAAPVVCSCCLYTTSVLFHLSRWNLLGVLIQRLFSHFSVQTSILCTSWQGQRILFRSFFGVLKCLIHRYKHDYRIPLSLFKFEPACLQYLRLYRTHTKQENYSCYGILSKNCSRLPSLSSPRSIEALCITWWHP